MGQFCEMCLPAPGVSSAFAGADVLMVKDHHATQILADLRQCGGAKVHSVTVATQRKWPSESVLRVSFCGAALWDLLQT